MKIYLLGDPDGCLMRTFKLQKCEIFQTVEKITLNELNDINPSWVISYNYRHLISQEFIDAMKSRIINLHISYLPWNRGADPNVWSHLENTPKGVTIHQIDAGIDTGPLLIQKKIDFDESMTLKESYELLNAEILNLFWSIWPNIEDFFKNRRPQSGSGTFHSLKDRVRFEEYLGKEGWGTSIAQFKNAWENRAKSHRAAS